MSIAATTHRAKGPLAAKGGFELPLTNLAAAAALVAAGPGKFRLGPSLPRSLGAVAAAGGALLAAGLLTRMLTAQPAVQAGPPSSEPSSEPSGRPVHPGGTDLPALSGRGHHAPAAGPAIGLTRLASAHSVLLPM